MRIDEQSLVDNKGKTIAVQIPISGLHQRR